MGPSLVRVNRELDPLEGRTRTRYIAAGEASLSQCVCLGGEDDRHAAGLCTDYVPRRERQPGDRGGRPGRPSSTWAKNRKLKAELQRQTRQSGLELRGQPWQCNRPCTTRSTRHGAPVSHPPTRRTAKKTWSDIIAERAAVRGTATNRHGTHATAWGDQGHPLKPHQRTAREHQETLGG